MKLRRETDESEPADQRGQSQQFDETHFRTPHDRPALCVRYAWRCRHLRRTGEGFSLLLWRRGVTLYRRGLINRRRSVESKYVEAPPANTLRGSLFPGGPLLSARSWRSRARYRNGGERLNSAGQPVH